MYYDTKSYLVYSLNTVYYKIFFNSYETVLRRIEQCSILNTSLSWPFIFIQSKLSIWGLHICICTIIKHMVLARYGRLLKYWCAKACCCMGRRRRFMEYIGGKLKSLYSYLDLPFSAVLVRHDVLQQHFFVLSKILSSSSS